MPGGVNGKRWMRALGRRPNGVVPRWQMSGLCLGGRELVAACASDPPASLHPGFPEQNFKALRAFDAVGRLLALLDWLGCGVGRAKGDVFLFLFLFWGSNLCVRQQTYRMQHMLSLPLQ